MAVFSDADIDSVRFVDFCYFAFPFAWEAEAEAAFHLMKDASAEEIDEGD